MHPPIDQLLLFISFALFGSRLLAASAASAATPLVVLLRAFAAFSITLSSATSPVVWAISAASVAFAFVASRPLTLLVDRATLGVFSALSSRLLGAFSAIAGLGRVGALLFLTIVVVPLRSVKGFDAIAANMRAIGVLVG